MPAPKLGEQFASFEAQDSALRFGMWVFLASEALLFAGLFALYAAYRALHPRDFLEAIHHNTLAFGTINTYVLLTSSLTAALAVAAARADRPDRVARLLGATIGLGFLFLVLKGLEYALHVREGALPGRYFHLAELPSFGANRFFTLYWVMTGLHALHVCGGLVVLAWMLHRARAGWYGARHHTMLELGTLYWHLIDVVWIFLWPLLYLS